MIDLRPLEFGHAREIADRQAEVYPESMHEPLETFQRLVTSTNLSRGAFHEDMLAGWILFEPRRGPRVYVYDLAVRPVYQRTGIATSLIKATFTECRWRGLRIDYHTRQQSYSLLANAPLLTSLGYYIVKDQFIRDYYAAEYESDALKGEHAHFVVVRPIGTSSSTNR